MLNLIVKTNSRFAGTKINVKNDFTNKCRCSVFPNSLHRNINKFLEQIHVKHQQMISLINAGAVLWITPDVHLISVILDGRACVAMISVRGFCVALSFGAS